MSEKQWETFFDLMSRIVDLPGLSANEKRAEVRRQAADNGADGDLSEFGYYCSDEE